MLSNRAIGVALGRPFVSRLVFLRPVLLAEAHTMFQD
jgi:hypothetical protein